MYNNNNFKYKNTTELEIINQIITIVFNPFKIHTSLMNQAITKEIPVKKKQTRII